MPKLTKAQLDKALTALQAVDRPPVVGSKPANVTAKPPMYAVILHNDNSSLPEFVGMVIHEAFGLDERNAMNKMLEAHRGGKSIITVLTRDQAETRIASAEQFRAGARRGVHYVGVAQCELTFTMQPETAGE